MPKPKKQGRLRIHHLHFMDASYQMTDVDSGLKLFIATGRTGRRNALANIKDREVLNTSTGNLPFQLDKLKCSDDNESNATDTASSSTPSTNVKDTQPTEQNDKTS